MLLPRWRCGLLVLVLLASSGCSYLPEDTDLRPDVRRTETANYIALRPDRPALRETGILFYPGGLVDPHGYLSPLQDLAAEGYPVVAVKVTGNLAIWNIGKAADYRDVFPTVQNWILVGHSLGGAVACRDILQERDAYRGLVLWAAFPGDGAPMDDWDGAVLSIYGEHDLVAEVSEVDANRVNLPPAVEYDPALNNFPVVPTAGRTIYVPIAGGNHAQFGSYGPQEGDGEATLSQAAQHARIVEAMERFFNANEWY